MHIAQWQIYHMALQGSSVWGLAPQSS